jgi:hypothetical protein
MADQSNRLTKSSGYTIADVIRMSWKYYKSTDGDNKSNRAKKDIISAKCIARQNYEYNRSLGKWEQVGRDIKIEFIVRSDPKSYKKTDKVSIHKYPVVFIIHSLELGINSTFKWRTGSLKKPIFKNPSMTSQQIGEKNIRNGIQLNFFYYLEFVLKTKNLLYGRCWATYPPMKTNPHNKIFFDKTAFYCAKILIKILQTNGGILRGKIYKNKDFK